MFWHQLSIVRIEFDLERKVEEKEGRERENKYEEKTKLFEKDNSNNSEKIYSTNNATGYEEHNHNHNTIRWQKSDGACCVARKPEAENGSAFRE